MNTAKKIGLFGGSFDPPHLGHVALVHAGLAMGLDEVWVLPALPVHRVLSGCADGATRLQWLEQVFEHDTNVKVLDWEVSQFQPTPAVDTLRRFKSLYPDVVPWLMLGADAWTGITSWSEYPCHQALCNVVVFARQTTVLAGVIMKNSDHAGWQDMTLDSWSDCLSAGHRCDVSVVLPDVSATMIREYADLGLSLSDLVPKVLHAEIENRYMKKKQCD